MHKKKILIVDDETDALSILEKELAARGYSIITAENGKDALISAKSKHPNLIILDVALPDMLGGEVAVKLKEDLGTKNIPVIFLSAMFTKTEESKRGHVVRSNIMFAKPYDIGELLAAIKKLLGEKRKYRLKKRRRVNGPKKICLFGRFFMLWSVGRKRSLYWIPTTGYSRPPKSFSWPKKSLRKKPKHCKRPMTNRNRG